jgi:hypothetical protein
MNALANILAAIGFLACVAGAIVGVTMLITVDLVPFMKNHLPKGAFDFVLRAMYCGLLGGLVLAMWAWFILLLLVLH